MIYLVLFSAILASLLSVMFASRVVGSAVAADAEPVPFLLLLAGIASVFATVAIWLFTIALPVVLR